MADLTHIKKEEGRNIQVFWRADLTGFGSVKFKETQRRACTNLGSELRSPQARFVVITENYGDFAFLS